MEGGALCPAEDSLDRVPAAAGAKKLPSSGYDNLIFVFTRGRPAALDSSTTWISFLPYTLHIHYFISNRMCIFFEYHMTLCPPLLYCSIVLLGADMTAGPGQAPPARPLPYPLLGARLDQSSATGPTSTLHNQIAAAKHHVFSHTNTNSGQTSVLLLLRRRRMKVVGQSGQTGGKMVKSRKFKFLSLI